MGRLLFLLVCSVSLMFFLHLDHLFHLVFAFVSSWVVLKTCFDVFFHDSAVDLLRFLNSAISIGSEFSRDRQLHLIGS